MKEILDFVEKEIERVQNIELRMVYDDGEETECCICDDVFHDGQVDGMYLAYSNVKAAIVQLKNK